MKKLIVSVLSSLVLVSGGIALASPQGPQEDKPVKVALCHRTDSENNPWVVQEVNANEVKSHLAKGDVVYDGLLKATDRNAYLACGVNVDKQVKDVTTGSAYVEANDQSSALAVNVGDTLTYKITVKGNPIYLSRLELDDLLPAGVTPTDPTQKHIDAQAKNEVVYITVTVNATTGFVTNTACLNLEPIRIADVAPTGEKSDENDVSVKCDSAVVSVTPPATPSPSASPSPTPSVTPTPTPVVTPAVLPDTGGSGRTRP